MKDDKAAFLLSNFINFKNVTQVKQIGDYSSDQCQIFVESQKQRKTPFGMLNTKPKKRKITIIKRKKHRDGSIESTKHEIFKNYGDEFQKRLSRQSPLEKTPKIQIVKLSDINFRKRLVKSRQRTHQSKMSKVSTNSLKSPQNQRPQSTFETY